MKELANIIKQLNQNNSQYNKTVLINSNKINNNKRESDSSSINDLKNQPS
jgi:hypothetical protein